METVELKPCPFCGGDIVRTIIDDIAYMTNPHTAVCKECGACGPNTHSSESAIVDWNTRPEEDRLRARIAELEGAQKWRPTDSAPKDGTDILLAWKNSDDIVIAWWNATGWTWHEAPTVYASDECRGWLPLPPLPEEEK